MPRDFYGYVRALSPTECKGLLEELACAMPLYAIAEVIQEVLSEEDCTELCVKLSQGAEHE